MVIPARGRRSASIPLFYFRCRGGLVSLSGAFCRTFGSLGLRVGVGPAFGAFHPREGGWTGRVTGACGVSSLWGRWGFLQADCGLAKGRGPVGVVCVGFAWWASNPVNKGVIEGGLDLGWVATSCRFFADHRVEHVLYDNSGWGGIVLTGAWRAAFVR